MKHYSLLLLPLLFLAACAPPRDVSYCKSYGETEGTIEFTDCLNYYHKQNAIFQRDLSICNEQADVTYPPSLYDNGSYRHARVYNGGLGYGFGHHGHGYGRGGFGHDTYIDIEPDYRKNAMIDDLRHRIILPCMNQKGWQSAQSWELGRIGGK